MQDVLERLGININIFGWFVMFSLIWVRILVMGTMIPFLLAKPVPRTVLVAVSAALALFAYPALVPDKPPQLSENLMLLVALYFKEIFYGFAIGFSVSLLFHAFEAVGQMIDNQRGVSIARILIPQLGEQGSISGMFLFQLAIVTYLAIGGHRIFFDGFFMSYKTLPLLSFPKAGPGLMSLVDLIANVSGEIFLISLQLAAPVIIAIFLADIILGIANRVAPQINVWELGFNVKGYIGILLLFVSIGMIGSQISHYTEKANETSAKAIYYLEGHVAVPPAEAGPPEEGMQKPEAGPPSIKTVP